MRYEERGQGYHDVEKVGKHWCRGCLSLNSEANIFPSEGSSPYSLVRGVTESRQVLK